MRRGSTSPNLHDGRTEEVFEELDPPPPVIDPSPVSFVGAYDVAPVPPASLPTKPLVRRPSGATYPHDGRTVTVFEDDSAPSRSPSIFSDPNIVPPMVVPPKPPLVKSLVRQDSTLTYPHDGRTVKLAPPSVQQPSSPAVRTMNSWDRQDILKYMVAGTRPRTPPLSGSELRESKAVPVKLDEAKPAVGQMVALGRGQTHSRKFRTGKPMEGATVAGQSRGYFASGNSPGPMDYTLRQHIEQDRNPVGGAMIAYIHAFYKDTDAEAERLDLEVQRLETAGAGVNPSSRAFLAFRAEAASLARCLRDSETRVARAERALEQEKVCVDAAQLEAQAERSRAAALAQQVERATSEAREAAAQTAAHKEAASRGRSEETDEVNVLAARNGQLEVEVETMGRNSKRRSGAREQDTHAVLLASEAAVDSLRGPSVTRTRRARKSSKDSQGRRASEWRPISSRLGGELLEYKLLRQLNSIMEEVKGGYLKVKEAVVETVRWVSRSLSPSRPRSSRAQSPSRSRDGRTEAQSPSQSRHSRADAGSSSQSQDGRAETRSLSPSGRDVNGADLKTVSSAIGSDSVAECLLGCVPIPGITLALKGLVVIFDAAAALHYNKQLALELSDYMRKIVVAINDKLLNDVYADSKEKLENDLKESTDEMTKFLAEFKKQKQEFRQPAVQKPDPVILDLPSVPREFHQQYEKLVMWAKLLVDIQEALLQIQNQSAIEQMIKFRLNEQCLEKLSERIDTELNLDVFGTVRMVAGKQEAVKKDLERLAADGALVQANITEILNLATKSALHMFGFREAAARIDTTSRLMLDAVLEFRSDLHPPRIKDDLNEFHHEIGSKFHSDGDREFVHSMRCEEYPDLTTWTPSESVLENAFKKLVQGNLVRAQTLNLEKKGIKDRGVKALADAIKALQPHWKITNLYIGEGAKELAHSLVNCTTFEILHLSGSKNINDDCAASLAELLEKGNLKKLHLAGCNISDAGVESLSKGLRKNKTLTHLSLYGAKYLAQAIEVNGSLTQLNLRGVWKQVLVVLTITAQVAMSVGGQIDFEGVKDLAKVLLRDKELDSLNLDLNVLSFENFKELEHMVDEEEHKYYKDSKMSLFVVSYQDSKALPPIKPAVINISNYFTGKLAQGQGKRGQVGILMSPLYTDYARAVQVLEKTKGKSTAVMDVLGTIMVVANLGPSLEEETHECVDLLFDLGIPNVVLTCRVEITDLIVHKSTQLITNHHLLTFLIPDIAPPVKTFESWKIRKFANLDMPEKHQKKVECDSEVKRLELQAWGACNALDNGMLIGAAVQQEVDKIWMGLIGVMHRAAQGSIRRMRFDFRMTWGFYTEELEEEWSGLPGHGEASQGSGGQPRNT
ncbi:hypothetical protein HDU93_001341 [Gonapodya sp. JEL0774]|nr:hypothetical protein HDU93_001341 [Gonapodya sp. JEL0774]